MRLGAMEISLLVVLAIGYFVPTIIAISRNHRNSGGIIALNILLGWSILGWIGALIWSLTSSEKTVVVVNNHQNNTRQTSATVNSTTQHASFRKEETKENNFDQRLEQLSKLKSMLDSGILSEEEFSKEKSKVLTD